MAGKKTFAILESEMIERLSLITGYHRQEVRDIIKAQTEFVLDEIASGLSVRLGGLGELEVLRYKGRGGYDFYRKQNINDKEIVRVKFKPSVPLKRAVKCNE